MWKHFRRTAAIHLHQKVYCKKKTPHVRSFVPIIHFSVFFGGIGHPLVRGMRFDIAKFVFDGHLLQGILL